MKKIASFTIDHTRLKRGVYVSRRDHTPAGDTITTFDIRLTEPNRMPAVSPRALHTIEHLAATYLRNDPTWADRIVYWGPMGCCTGSYLLVQGVLEPADNSPTKCSLISTATTPTIPPDSQVTNNSYLCSLITQTNNNLPQWTL